MHINYRGVCSLPHKMHIYLIKYFFHPLDLKLALFTAANFYHFNFAAGLKLRMIFFYLTNFTKDSILEQNQQIR